MLKKCKIYQNKGSQRITNSWDLTKIIARGPDLSIFENLPGVARGHGNAWN